MSDTKFTTTLNAGVFFAVKAKRHPKAPDYHGDIYIDMSTVDIVDGKCLVKLSGWKKTSKAGNTYLSLAVDTFKPDSVRRKEEPKKVDEEDLF